MFSTLSSAALNQINTMSIKHEREAKINISRFASCLFICLPHVDDIFARTELTTDFMVARKVKVNMVKHLGLCKFKLSL